MTLLKTRTSTALALAVAQLAFIAMPSGAAEPTNMDTVQVTKTRPKEEIYLQYNYFDSLFGGYGPRENGGGGAAPNTTAKEQDTTDHKGDCPNAKGNPVVLYTGNKVEAELDFAARGEFGLFLQRTYNHHWSATGLFGNHWMTNFDFSLSFSNSEGLAWLQRPDGRRIKLIADSSGNRWNEDKAQAVAYLIRNADGSFTLYNENRGIEIYDAEGYITRLQNEQGVAWFFAYAAGYLQSVTHSSGRSVKFSWNDDQLVQVTDPAGNIYRYTYTPNAFDFSRSRLASAILPGSPTTTVSYHYEDARYPGGLTGKSFNGVRYSYFAYDENQRATLSEHAGSVERHTFSYNIQETEQVVPAPAPVRPGGLRGLEGSGWCDYRVGGKLCYPTEVNNQSRMAAAQASTASTAVTKPHTTKMSVTETNPLGRKTTYAYEDGLQVSITGDASPRCAASYKERTYDANGYPDIVGDFADNLTDFDYSPQGFLLKKVEAVGTSAERTTTYEWDTAANRQLKETILGDSETSYTYEGRGNIASITVRNLSNKGVAGQARTTHYTYTYHANGLKASMTVDGPLPQDNVTYTFNTLGDMTSVSNGLGQTTTYSNYTGLGEAGRVTGPNGDVTELNRDARGRLTSQKQPAGTGWATTSLTYDGAGNVATTTSPDGITTRHQYDAARRLIAETRPFGNGNYAWTQHTYDSASNRTRTEVSLTDYPADTTVNGYVDTITYEGVWNWYIAGWACSTGSTTPIRVDAYADGGSFIGSATANKPSEAAVGAACQSNGTAYRYEIPITLAQRQQLGGKSVTVYGISPRGGAFNKALGNSGTLKVPTAAIIGEISGITSDANGNHYLNGWACSVGVRGSVDVHLYVGGAAGTGSYVTAVTANLPSDGNVANACQTQATNYTFRVPLTTAIRDVHSGRALFLHGITVVATLPSDLLRHSGGYTVPGLTRTADLVSFSANPNHVFNGQQSTLTVQFRNTGNYLWEAGTYLAWGTTVLDKSLPLSAPVPPGAVATFQWTVSPYHNGSGIRSYPYIANMADSKGALGSRASFWIPVENPNVYCPPNKPYCEEPW